MYNEKTSSLQLPDKRFIYCHKYIDGKKFKHIIYDTNKDEILTCDEKTPKAWNNKNQLFIIKKRHEWFSPKLHRYPNSENICYVVISFNDLTYKKDSKILQYKIKNLGINFRVEQSPNFGNLDLIILSSEEDQAILEFYFGQYIEIISIKS